MFLFRIYFITNKIINRYTNFLLQVHVYQPYANAINILLEIRIATFSVKEKENHQLFQTDSGTNCSLLLEKNYLHNFRQESNLAEVTGSVTATTSGYEDF